MDSQLEIIVEATQAIAATPESPEPYKRRAMALCRMGQWEEAVDDLTYMIDVLHSDDAQIYQLRAAIRMNHGNRSGALEDMRRAVELEPDLLQGVSGEFKL